MLITDFRAWKDKGPIPKTTLLRLEQGCGEVRLIACDKSGARLPQGFILAIDCDGTLVRNRGVNENIGLRLEGGRIAIKGE